MDGNTVTLKDIDLAISDHRTTSNRVCEIIRRAIILRALPMGERLVEAKIAKELGVSITPVREAFSQLANMGLLTVYPFKGTYVTVVTQEYVQDVNFVRERIEVAAVDLSFDRLTPEDADKVEEFSKASDFHFRSDLLKAIECDMQCHQLFMDKCGNELLVQMWDILSSRVQIIQAYAKPAHLPADYMQTRHGDIVACMRSHDKPGLIEALSFHIRTSSRHGNFPSADQVDPK